MNAKEKFSKDIKSATVVNVKVIKFNSLVADMEKSFSFLDGLNQICFINQSIIQTKSQFLNSVKAGGKLQKKILRPVDWLGFKKRHHLIITKCSEETNANAEATASYPEDLAKTIDGGYTKQIYNADKTALC